jgi:hypothetical protein
MGKLMMAQIARTEIPDTMRDEMAEHEQQILDLVNSEMSFAKMKDSYIDAYASVFTQEELEGLLEFYKSPSGKAFAVKLPLLTKQLLGTAQVKMQALMPKIQKMNDDFLAGLNQESQPK